MATKQPEKMTFEESVDELEGIIAQLETGETNLEDSLKQFERGITLARASQTKLQQAEQKVSILLNQQEDAKLEPFQTDLASDD